MGSYEDINDFNARRANMPLDVEGHPVRDSLFADQVPPVAPGDGYVGNPRGAVDGAQVQRIQDKVAADPVVPIDGAKANEDRAARRAAAQAAVEEPTVESTEAAPKPKAPAKTKAK